MTRLLPARPSTPCARVFERLARDQDAVDPGLELAWNREIVHGRAEHDDVGRQKLLQHRLASGDVGLQAGLGAAPWLAARCGPERWASGVRREIAIAHLKAGIGFAQPFDDGGGNLAADGVGAENAGVDVQKFHG